MRLGGITGLHPTRDGHLYIPANTPHFWQALCERIGLPELARDERYDSVRKRAQRQAEILPLLHGALQARAGMKQVPQFLDAAGFKARIDETYKVHAELVPTLGIRKD